MVLSGRLLVLFRLKGTPWLSIILSFLILIVISEQLSVFPFKKNAKEGYRTLFLICWCYLSSALKENSSEVVQPFLMGCGTKEPKITQLCLAAVQRLMSHEVVSEVWTASHILNHTKFSYTCRVSCSVSYGSLSIYRVTPVGLYSCCHSPVFTACPMPCHNHWNSPTERHCTTLFTWRLHTYCSYMAVTGLCCLSHIFVFKNKVRLYDFVCEPMAYKVQGRTIKSYKADWSGMTLINAQFKSSLFY